MVNRDPETDRLRQEYAEWKGQVNQDRSSTDRRFGHMRDDLERLDDERQEGDKEIWEAIDVIREELVMIRTKVGFWGALGTLSATLIIGLIIAFANGVGT